MLHVWATASFLCEFGFLLFYLRRLYIEEPISNGNIVKISKTSQVEIERIFPT